MVVFKQGEPSSLGTIYQHFQGKYHFIKNIKNIFVTVTQLIKSRSKANKLGVLFEGGTRKDYTFTDMQVILPSALCVCVCVLLIITDSSYYMLHGLVSLYRLVSTFVS